MLKDEEEEQSAFLGISATQVHDFYFNSTYTHKNMENLLLTRFPPPTPNSNAKAMPQTSSTTCSLKFHHMMGLKFYTPQNLLNCSSETIFIFNSSPRIIPSNKNK